MPGVLKLSGVTLPPGPAYRSLASFRAPNLSVNSGLVGLYKFGGGEDFSVVNLVAGGAEPSKVGSPTFGEAFDTYSQANCIDTGIAETSTCTLISVAKPANASVLIGSFENSHPIGALLVWQDGTTLRAAASKSASPSVPCDLTIGSPAADDFYLFAARVDVANVKVDYARNGTKTSNSVSLPSRLASERTWKIGGHTSPGVLTGSNVQALAAIYDRALSDGELDTVFGELRDYFALLGITTL